MIKAFAILAFAGLANAGAITYGAAPVAAYGAHPAVQYASSPYAQTYAAHPGVYGSPYAHAVAQPLAYAQPIAKAVAPVAYAQPIAKAVAPVAYAQPVAKAVVASPEPFDPHPQYNYGYSVSDALTGDSKTAHETRDGDVVSGQYSLVEPDGAIRTVTYTSDPVNGFNAVVDRQAPAVVAKTVAAPVVAKAVAPVAYAQPIAKAVHPAYLG